MKIYDTDKLESNVSLMYSENRHVLILTKL